MNIFKELGLKEVVNANGKMTIIGTSTASDAVSSNMKAALENYVIIDELIDFTGKVIAQTTKASAGCPTCGAAAGIAIATAACIAGRDLNLVEQMPCSDGMKNEVIIQKGHVVNFGGNIGQMIRMGGGKLVEAGCANKVENANVENAITDHTAALFYTKSHHAVQKGMVSLKDFIAIGKHNSIPVIVDAAAEEDMSKYIEMGADLVIYSGGKALCGPTSGFICGTEELIGACKMQYKGIGRAMKVSKEAMVGLITALRNYDPKDLQPEEEKAKMNTVCDELNKVNGLSCRIIQDEAGREIYRAEIKVDEAVTKISAALIEDKLKNGNPAIYLRFYNANQGILHVDPRPLFDGQEKIIVDAIKKIVK